MALTVASDEVQLAELAAERVTQLITQAVADRGTACVALAGGTTPRRLYEYLADARHTWHSRIPWSQVQLFWSDERHVPPDHPDSNYRMAKAALIDHVPIPVDHVHRIHGELPDARDAAVEYEGELDRVASAAPPSHLAPAFRRKDHYFDVMLLGLGEDAHIASIFPGSELLEPDVGHPFAGCHAAAVWAPHLNVWRITLTPEAVLDSAHIVVLVAGARKANAAHSALEEPLNVKTHPAQSLRAAGTRVEWYLDRAAASRL